jgi:hypothetical protein
MFPLRTGSLIAGLLVAACAESGPAPQECAGCRIEAAFQMQIGGGGADSLALLGGPPASILEDAAGRFWVFSYGSLPMLFGAEGEFLQLVGEFGGGPGEFQYAQAGASLPGDSVIVFDANGRATVFSADLEPARTITVPGRGVTDVVVLDWPTRAVVASMIPTPESIGWPLHLVDMSGSLAEVLDSFGANEGRLLPEMTDMLRLKSHLTRSGDAIWAAEAGRYRIGQWSDNGIGRVIHRRPAWFAEASSMLPGGRVNPPAPVLVGLSADHEERLWVFGWVPGSNFADAWRNVPEVSGSGETRASDLILPLMYRTRIEILDPASGSVVVAGIWPRMVAGVLGPGRVATYEEDDAGRAMLRIYRLRLLQNRAG